MVEVGGNGCEVVVELAVAEIGTGVASVVVVTAGNVVDVVSVELGHSAEQRSGQDEERKATHCARQPPTMLSVNSACSLESTSGFG